VWDLILNPFVTLITFLYSVLWNDVVLAIIVFTVLIRLITVPLTLSQQKSQRAMQEIQPQIRKLQEKYGNDREKMAEEQMKLFREYGYNPLSGCLPLFIQLPILFALYQAIQYALASNPMQLLGLSNRLLIPGLDNLIPLNNVWLGMDLTLSPGGVNPLWSYALPALVLVTTWYQYKVTMPAAPPPQEGQQPDPAQATTQSMSTIMPLMFGFFSLSFPVGLSIYFVVSNLIGIIQYRLMPTVTPKAPQPSPEVVNARTVKTKRKA
jgi:YidC/Oxa1 family membrane protein insertase